MVKVKMSLLLKTLLSGTVILILSSCMFNAKEKRAIEICQKAKVQAETGNALADMFIAAYGLGANATWLDFANMIAKKEPNKKYSWEAKGTENKSVYLVCKFVEIK